LNEAKVSGLIMKSLMIIGAPVDCGGGQRGCLMGPDAMRTARLAETLASLGHTVRDAGNLQAEARSATRHPNLAIHDLDECVAWIEAIAQATFDNSGDGSIPIIIGGDHCIAAGTVPGAARRSEKLDQPQFVLWLDAHTDFHNLDSTQSGNLHGTPVAYFTGQPGFEGYLPELKTKVNPFYVCMLGIRSVDQPERDELAREAIDVHDMRAIDELGIAKPVRAFLERVAKANGRLHVSLDVDFLEPEIAPAVGTTVPGGATFREAHLVMEMLHDSDLVTSVDVAELNPFLDERGRTAKLMVDLIASLFGQRVLERRTRSY
jgi:arginase